MDKTANASGRCLVIIPAFNEERNIGCVLDGIMEHAPDVDVLVINDSSTDNTEEVVRSRHVNVLTLCTNLGYSGAVTTGYLYAAKHRYDYVIQFDADGQHDPRDIPRMILAIHRDACDIVIGSRFLEANVYPHGELKMLGTRLFSLMIRGLTGQHVSDPTSGLQILNRKAYLYYLKSGNFPEFPDANALILMIRLGFRIGELPVVMHERLSGQGMHGSLSNNAKYVVSMLYSIFFAFMKSGKSGKKVNHLGG